MSKRLEQLLKKESQLKAQIQQAKARERTKERKKETRRKLLVGSALMAQIETGEFSEQCLITMMDAFLTRDHERKLFGLSALQPDKPEQETNETVTVQDEPSPRKKRTTRKATATAKKKTSAKKTLKTNQAKPRA